MTADLTTRALSADQPDILARAGETVDAALRAPVRELAEPVRRVARYHFGWSAADGRPDNGDAGPMLPAAIVISAAAALACPPVLAVAGATAVELVRHSAVLLDDVIDRRQFRGGRPSAWTVFGEPLATLAGGALAALGLSRLLRDGARHAAPATERLVRAHQDMVAGQALAAELGARTNGTVEECRRLADQRTAALLSCSAALGGVLAGADPATVRAFAGFGRHLGLALHFAAEIDGIWGERAGADIRRRRKSLPVAYALGRPEAWRVARFYSLTHDPAPDEVAQIAAALADVGARDWAGAEVQRQIDAAMDNVRRTGLAADRIGGLTALTDLATIGCISE